MFVISNKVQNEQNPRLNSNHPEKRHGIILDRLNSNHKITFPKIVDNITNIIEKVHDPLLLDFLENSYNSLQEFPDDCYYNPSGL